jgi:hypothetical protein
MPITPKVADRLAETFRLLGNPTTLGVLVALDRGPLSRGALAEATDATYLHRPLSLLCAAGLIAGRRVGQGVVLWALTPRGQEALDAVRPLLEG